MTRPRSRPQISHSACLAHGLISSCSESRPANLDGAATKDKLIAAAQAAGIHFDAAEL